MTFATRQINLQFSQAGKTLVILEGLRCTAMVLNPGGNNAFAQLQLRVYGMTLAQMNQFSSTGAVLVANEKFQITVLAGNEGSTIGQIFSGGIVASYIDFSAQPEVAFVVTAQSGYFEKASPAAANSWSGTQNAEDLIEALAKSINYGFSKSPTAHAIVQNQYAYGSVIDQMKRIASAACLPLSIENNTAYLWENGGTKNNVVVNLSAETGLVGYPSYYEAGFIVRSEYNPDITLGVTINLTSVIPKANGKFAIYESLHELSTLTPDGAWFTTAKLSTVGIPNVPKN